jgi:glyoxylase-like metal-dependent hydrolase (beta-lactamase superfamily II)
MTGWPEQRIEEVADGVVAVLQGSGEAGVSNAGLVLGESRALVVDTMAFPEMARGIVAELQRRGARPDVVLNTHHHIDHIGGNSLLAEAGARLVAHPETVRVIEASGHPVAIYDGFMPAFRGRWGDIDIVVPEPYARPDALELPRDAELRAFVPAHTPADVAVWLERERVVFTGDLCFFGVAPLAVQALLSGWIAALDALIALEPATVVPGHGPIGTKADIAVLCDYLSAVLATGRAAVDAGATLDEALAELDPGPVGEWVEAERSVVNLERAMQEARAEIAPNDLTAIPASFGRLMS